MKKFFIPFLAAVAVVFASCSNNKSETSQKNISLKRDTTIMIPGSAKITTAPRWSCSGKRLPQDRLVSVETGNMVPLNISLSADTTITVAGDGETVYGDGGDTSTSSGSGKSWFGSILPGLLEFLAVLLLLVAAGWLLWYLINNWPASKSGGSSPGAGASSAGAQKGSRATADTSNIAQLTALVTALGNAGGGVVDHEEVYVKVGPDAPLVHVENSGMNSNSGHVNLHFGDRNEETNMTDHHHHHAHYRFEVKKEKPADEKKDS